MEGKQIFETYESEVRSYCRVFDAVLSTAKGAVITDTEGNMSAFSVPLERVENVENVLQFIRTFATD